MFTSDDYLIAWGFYLLGAIGLMTVLWHITRKIKWLEVRKLLRLTAAVLILTPYYADPLQPYLAPALLMCLLEGLFEGGDAMWRAGVPILVSLFSAIVLSLMVELWWRKVILKRQQERRLDTERQALLKESHEATESVAEVELEPVTTEPVEGDSDILSTGSHSPG